MFRAKVIYFYFVLLSVIITTPVFASDPSNTATGFFGFNMEELKLLAKYPTQTKRAYELSRVANDATDRVLKRNLPNDESDAFRHFVWAGLMVKFYTTKK